MSQTAKPLAAAAIAQLESDGVATLIGTVVNPAGLTHAKTVPLRRMGIFAEPGLGASPVFHAFTIDQTGIVFSDAISVVGDQRIRIDLGGLRILGDGLAWAPGAFFNQDGSPDPYCARGTLQRVQDRLAAADITALVGHEMEFVLVGPDGSRLPSVLWAQYGLAGLLEFEGFVRDVTNSATASGVAIEQFHPEYGANQFEISLAPQPPVAAADQLVLMRIIVARVARRYGMRVSLSPVPFAGSVGSGSHQHFSLSRGDVTGVLRRVRRAGDDAGGGIGGGRTARRTSCCAGRVVRIGAVGPAHPTRSLVRRVQLLGHREPGSRSAIPHRRPQQPIRRQCRGQGHRPVGQPLPRHGRHPRSGSPRNRPAARAGHRRRLSIPARSATHNATGNGIVLLPAGQGEALATLDASTLIRGILGDDPVDAVLAVRRYEQQNFGDLQPEELAAKFRMAWSV